MNIANHIHGEWIEGKGPGVPLVDPVTGEELARASSDGIDVAKALTYARETGGRALRAMSFAERGAMLRAASETMIKNRDKYSEIALKNSGNTSIDAAIDIDGGTGTLMFYSSIGKRLGDATTLRDVGFERMGKDEAFQVLHLWVPLRGVGVHINAFNFPSWGIWEKVAVSILAGVPVLAKPATATALLSHEMVKDVIEASVFPAGALSLVCGGARDLMDHVTSQDVVAFTGSAETARDLRRHSNAVAQSTRINVEADSLNLSLLGPDATPEAAEFNLFVKEVAREMTVKAGQKCTAIRRALVPADLMGDVVDALEAQLSHVVTGNPRNKTVRMGPLINKAQQKTVLNGIRGLQAETDTVTGGVDSFEPVDADAAVSAFVPPTLMRCADPAAAKAIHEIEVFGPVCTVMPYKDVNDAVGLASRGGGSLVASVFSGDDTFAAEVMWGIAPDHGRVLVMNEKLAGANTGHGTVMPMCVHGGPGRAGGGEELGGVRGLRLYHQRVAVQGHLGWLESLVESTAEATL